MNSATPGELPLWEALSGRAVVRPALAEVNDAQTVIVGGGVAGLSLALHLAGLGHRPVVIEADRIGSGAVGRSGGLVVPHLARQTPASVQARLGRDKGGRLLHLIAEAGSYTFGMLGGADCGASQGGFLAPVRGSASAARPAATVDEWRPFRSDLSVLDAAATRGTSGCRGYQAALRDPTGGSLNPLAYARHLAAEAERLGATLFERSPVSGIEAAAGGWRVKTEGGSIVARSVFLCANGGNAALHPALSHTVLPLPVCQVATEPLAAEMRASILPGGEALTDMEPDVFTIRFEPGGRLVTAYPTTGEALDPDRIDAAVNNRLRATLPGYRETRLAYVWQGVAWLNGDFLPRLASVAEGLYAVQACNGRGIAFNTIFGRHLAEWHAGGRTQELAVEAAPPRPIPGYFFARHAPRLLMKAALLAQRVRGSFASTNETA